MNIPSFILKTKHMAKWPPQVSKVRDLIDPCVTLQSLDPPQYVFWYHNGKLINYDRVSRISIKTDPGESESS